ncbi:PREDICTED: uncharacterized protein LOC105144373 [Acromyrmex echinatior]|uniref:uncharacterized protein LOC105144373 n=1 Tax=Acromyrmex echinatior TaxID=103372 RepID=UPI000580B9EC|nr:PREDICTED: uncharacterized protein LOC105144373 [Acromyrmex echinatior]
MTAGGEVALAVSLDIANAFNSVSWDQVVGAMREHHLLPPYLVAVVKNYFRDRQLEFHDKRGLQQWRDTSCGVPQSPILRLPRHLLCRRHAGDNRGHDLERAVCAANVAVACVVGSIRELGLRVASAKTEGFIEHFDRLAPRFGSRADALLSLMPNLRGPNESVKRTYMHAVLSGAFYGAPVWSERVLANRRIQERLHNVQRQLALRICRAYRCRMWSSRGSPLPSTWPTPWRRPTPGEWRATLENGPPTTGNWTVEAILPCLEKWVGKGWGGLSFHTTQVVLTGHGCFGEYLRRIGNKLTARCRHCDGDRDTAQHTLEARARCPSPEDRG